MSEKKNTEPPVIALLAGLEKGQTAAELETTMCDAVRAALGTKKKATVKLVFTIEAGDDESAKLTERPEGGSRHE